MTKKLFLAACLLLVTLAANAQFEKGKWVINTSVTGLDLSHDTGTGHTNFGLEARGGAFLADNFALLLHLGADWRESAADTYGAGVGGRYYFQRSGIYLGANVNVERFNYSDKALKDESKFSFGLEAGYAFFLSRTVTLEPGVYWKIYEGHSRYGLKVGFGFYF